MTTSSATSPWSGSAGDSTPGIRRAAPPDAPRLISVLARAFADDPVVGWCIPSRADRRTYLPELLRVVVDALIAHDETYIAAHGDATALWVPVGRDPLTTEQEAVLGAQIERLPDDDAQRIYELTSLMAECRPREPSYHLGCLAVAPESRGRGLGSQLLDHAVRRCDAQGVPAYLEATSPRNRDLCARHGFRVTGEIAVVGAPPLWGMWRDPR